MALIASPGARAQTRHSLLRCRHLPFNLLTGTLPAQLLSQRPKLSELNVRSHSLRVAAP